MRAPFSGSQEGGSVEEWTRECECEWVPMLSHTKVFSVVP